MIKSTLLAVAAAASLALASQASAAITRAANPIGTITIPNIAGGSANAPFTQGTGAAGAASLNAYLGGGIDITAAGTSAPSGQGVQGMTGGVPLAVMGSISNTGFNALGSAGTAVAQGVGPATANSPDVFVGGAQAGTGFNALGSNGGAIATDTNNRITIAAFSSSIGVTGAYAAGTNASNPVQTGCNSQATALSATTAGKLDYVACDLYGDVQVQQSLGYVESTASLGVSPATFTGTPRAPLQAMSSYYCKMSADQSGTVSVYESDNSGTSYYLAASATFTAGGAAAVAKVQLTGTPAASLYQCREANTSATAQTTNSLTSAFAAN